MIAATHQDSAHPVWRLVDGVGGRERHLCDERHRRDASRSGVAARSRADSLDRSEVESYGDLRGPK